MMSGLLSSRCCRASRAAARVLNGIFWVLRSGAPWRDLPNAFGPYTTCYNRFVRWRRAGVWARIMNAPAGAQDAAVQMIDTPIDCFLFRATIANLVGSGCHCTTTRYWRG